MKGPSITGAHPRTLAVLFLAVVGLPAIALVWLSLQLLEQDRSIAAQRETERRQNDLQSAARELEAALTAATKQLPPGAVKFAIGTTAITATPPDALYWLPTTPALSPASDRSFIEAERAEFSGDTTAALAAYQRLAAQPAPPTIQAAALLRIARVHWREHRWNEALEAYTRLAQIRNIAIEGLPADFVARRAKCDVLRDAARNLELQREAESLRADLLANRWTLDRSAWELASSQITAWTGRPTPIAADRQFMSELADWLWQQPSTGHPATLVLNGQPITLLWSSASVIAIPSKLLEHWLSGITLHANVISLANQSGQLLAGPKPEAGAPTLKALPTETNLPWTLIATPSPTSIANPEWQARRRLFAFGLAAIVLLLVGAAYLLWRVVAKELAVARLQSDFVAAVSHEFRTPLASMRHVTELLQENDDLARERRSAFYDSLARNTDRLHRLVESLLDFARMEGGRKPYELQPVDAAEFTTQVVSEFRAEARSRGYTVDLTVESNSALPVHADPTSLANALWNLLDNAVKYSPGKQAIHVHVRRANRTIEIAVADQGIGIPKREQKEVFRKFVRGAASKRLGIKGTGLGLAMVSHIVGAHGGSIDLASDEGTGSTFSIVLPERS